MHRQAILACAALACGLLPLWANAQTGAALAESPPVADATAAAPAAVPPAACADCVIIPALTPVQLEMMATLGSKVSRTGDTFPIRLVTAIIVDSKEVIPAGTMGVGEVVHAKKSGGMGAAGELVLAARYLDIGGQHLRLRSLHIALAGHSKIDTTNGVALAGAATVPPLMLVGYFLSGGQATVPQGTVAFAKTADAFSLELPAQIPTAPVSSNLQGEKK